MQWKRFTQLVLWHVFGNLGGVDPNLESGALSVKPHHSQISVPVDPAEVFPGSTCNTPSNRQCWLENVNITTDYEDEKFTPEGVVRNVTITSVLSKRTKLI